MKEDESTLLVYISLNSLWSGHMNNASAEAMSSIENELILHEIVTIHNCYPFKIKLH